MSDRDRIQKVLAARGFGSRREIESWIKAGRITVNRQPATPGQAIGPRDEVRLDGRRLRLRAAKEPIAQGVAYHRPPREGLRTASDDGERSSLDRLPRPAGGRWVAVSPMGLGEEGLELFVNDGGLAAALMGRADALSSEFSVRVRGLFDEARLDQFAAAAAHDAETGGRVEQVRFGGGEGANRWVQVVSAGLRPRDLKRIFERCGIEANRIIRTRFGPITMDRALARGVSRRLTPGEMASLADAAGIARQEAPRRAAPAAGRGKRRAAPAKPTGNRKRRR